MNLTHKRIAIIAHVLKYGQAQDLLKFLQDEETAETMFIAHPLMYVEGRPGSEMHLYEGNRVSKSHRLKNRKLPSLVQYGLDTFLTVLWVARTRRRWDLIVAFDNLNTFAALILRRLGLAHRVVFFTIDYVPQRFSNRHLNDAYHRLDRFCLRHADATWNVSDRIAEGREQVRGLRRADYPEQVTVPIGIWFNRFPRKSFEQVETYSLVYSGGLLPHQGIQLVLAALPELVAKFPKLVFYVTGIGPMEDELKDLANELDVRDHVRFLGYLESHEDLEELLARCSVAAAMYSADLDIWSYYADPSKIKSYLAAGLPIVTTSVTHISTELAARECGLVIPYDAHAFAEAVSGLMQDLQRLERYREKAANFAAEFDWPAVFGRALSDPRLAL